MKQVKYFCDCCGKEFESGVLIDMELPTEYYYDDETQQNVIEYATFGVCPECITRIVNKINSGIGNVFPKD